MPSSSRYFAIEDHPRMLADFEPHAAAQVIDDRLRVLQAELEKSELMQKNFPMYRKAYADKLILLRAKVARCEALIESLNSEDE